MLLKQAANRLQPNDVLPDNSHVTVGHESQQHPSHAHLTHEQSLQVHHPHQVPQPSPSHHSTLTTEQHSHSSQQQPIVTQIDPSQLQHIPHNVVLQSQNQIAPQQHQISLTPSQPLLTSQQHPIDASHMSHSLSCSQLQDQHIQTEVKVSPISQQQQQQEPQKRSRFSVTPVPDNAILDENNPLPELLPLKNVSTFVYFYYPVNHGITN